MIDDGQVNRLVGDRCVAEYRRTGQQIAITFDDGHTVRIGWADSMTGALINGVPQIVCNHRRYAGKNIVGKRIANALKNGHELILGFDDFTQLRFSWISLESGELVKGEPVIVGQDVDVLLPVPAPLPIGAAGLLQ